MTRFLLTAAAAVAVSTVVAASSPSSSLAIRDAQDDALAACPGYKASNVKTTATGLTADLTLAGTACNAYGTDIDDLVLSVSYDSGTSNFSH